VHPILENPNFPQILVEAAATGIAQRRNCSGDGRGAVVAVWLKCRGRELYSGDNSDEGL